MPADRAAPIAAPESSAPATLTVASAASGAAPPPSAPPLRAWPEPGKPIPLDLPNGTAQAWPPATPPAQGGAPVSVYYHGITASAELECPVAWGAMQHGWVLCADGNVPYGGGFTWSNPGAVARVDAALAALAAKHNGLVSDQRALLFGYSMGAIAAWYRLEHSSEHWTALVFLNTTLGVNAKVIREKGVQRVALVAGQFDGSAGPMAATASRLKRQGIDARFFSLEKTGHYFDDKTWNRMIEPLTWAFGGEASR